MKKEVRDEKAGWKAVGIGFAAVVAVAFSYAIVRYNVIKGVALAQLPLLISNKAISLAAVALIALSYSLGPLARWWPAVFVPKLWLRKYFGLLGFGLGAVHALISLLVFSPAYYPGFFAETGKLTLAGELSMLFGVLALFVFALVALASFPSIAASLGSAQWQLVQRAGYLALGMVPLHVLVMGLAGWLKPSGWPGGLLPISLLAFIIALFALLLRVAVAIFPGASKDGSAHMMPESRRI